MYYFSLNCFFENTLKKQSYERSKKTIDESQMNTSRVKCWITNISLVWRTNHNRLSSNNFAHPTNTRLRQQMSEKRNHMRCHPNRFSTAYTQDVVLWAMLSWELRYTYFRVLFLLGLFETAAESEFTSTCQSVHVHARNLQRIFSRSQHFSATFVQDN